MLKELRTHHVEFNDYILNKHNILNREMMLLLFFHNCAMFGFLNDKRPFYLSAQE